MNDSHDGVGIVVAGADEERPFYYYVAAGISPENRKVHFLSATGVADNEKFQTVDPATNPALFRETVIDAKFEHRTDKKKFYTTSVEDEFNRLLTENVNRIADILKSKDPDGELETFLSSRVREFRTSELTASFVELDDLRLEDAEKDSPDEEQESPAEPFDHEVSEDGTVRTIQPIIDVENGRSVNALSPGDALVVKLPGRRGEETSTEATFLEFSPTESDGAGVMLVRLDEDLLGRATVSRGSLLEVPDETDNPEVLGTLLEYLGYLLLVVIGVLLFLWFS